MNAPEFVEQFNAVFREAETMLSIVRDSGLQRNACACLEALHQDIASRKSKAIDAQDEDLANMLLGYQCAADVIRFQILMWLYLKESDPNEAWSQLVLAQESALAAVRAHPGFAHASHIYQGLLAIEKLIFPKQVFVSSGFLVERQECSICGAEYGECDHLVGVPYMGRFCQIITRGLTADHVALVKAPADKRCRVTSYSENGGNVDKMTLLWTPSAKPDDSPVAGMTVQANLAFASSK